jgi:hypothetical protein
MMRKVLIIAVALTAFMIFSNLIGQERTYVGALKCKTCHRLKKHGNQYQAWLDSRHNKSYAVLSSLSACEEAKKANLTTPPNESPECLKCHGPLYEKAQEFVNQGVACEVCHGPGSAYKKTSIMKNRAKSVENGLFVYVSQDDIKEKCVTCHTGEHFSFEASWEKIKHPVPPMQ